jgi:hypothetical protein
MSGVKIYLDDVRTPIEGDWIVVRSYFQFVDKINEIGLDNIELISLDHDLDETAMREWHTNTFDNYAINYDNIKEPTGLHCAIRLIEMWNSGGKVVDVVVHSANAIGSGNIMGVINHYRHIHKLPQNCVRVQIPHKNEKNFSKDL